MATGKKDLYCTVLTILTLVDGDVSPAELFFANALFEKIKPTIKLDWAFIESAASKKNRADTIRALKLVIDQKFSFILLAEMFLLALVHNNIVQSELDFIKEVAAATHIDASVVNKLSIFVEKIWPAINTKNKEEFDAVLKKNLPDFGFVPGSAIMKGIVAGAVAGSAFSPIGSVVGAFCGMFANSIRQFEVVDLKHLGDLYKSLIESTEVQKANSLSISLISSDFEYVGKACHYALAELKNLNSDMDKRLSEKAELAQWKEIDFVSKINSYIVGRFNFIESDFQFSDSNKVKSNLVLNYLASSEILIIPLLNKFLLFPEALSKEERKNSFSLLKIDSLTTILRRWLKGNFSMPMARYLLFVLVDDCDTVSTIVTNEFIQKSILASPYAKLIEALAREAQGVSPVFLSSASPSAEQKDAKEFSVLQLLQIEQSYGKKISTLLLSALLKKSRAFKIDDKNSFAGLLLKNTCEHTKTKLLGPLGQLISF